MATDYSQHIDIYCERLDPSFWAEPLNAISNLAFIIAAFAGFRLWQRGVNQRNEFAPDILALAILAAIVGIGSFIFHSIATRGAMLADIIPIIIFIHVGVVVIFHRILGLKWIYAILGMLAFAGFNLLFLKIFGRAALNGSIQYVPTFLLLLAVAGYSRWRKLQITGDFLIAAIAFLLSLICRSIDMTVCPELPIGTHFLWHILNSVTMYYVIRSTTRVVR